MDEIFVSIIREKIKLDLKSPIVIGFSGGIDSVCLATLFLHSSCPIIIAHFNHCLRDTADRDENFAREFALKRNLIFVSEKSDVSKFAKAEHLSIEEAARKKRYGFLFQVAKNYRSNAIAVAHHADDQIETVLMHLFRGSGMAGLLGMQEEVIVPEFDPQIKIIRPLLSFWKEDIERYCLEYNLDFVQDETNFSGLYERNRIRNEILPYLENHYPGLKRRLFRMSNVLAKEDEIVQEQLKQYWNDIYKHEGSQFIVLNNKKLLNFPLGIQRRIIRKSVFGIKPDCRDLTFDNIDRVIEFLQKGIPGEIDLQENITALFTNTEIIIGSKSKDWLNLIYPQLDDEILISDPRNNTIGFSDHWELKLENINKGEVVNLSHPDKFSVYINGDQFLPTQLRLRQRKDGDRFQPLGMEKGRIKLSDFFINEKIPKPAREKWPLLVNDQDEIIWVPGYRQNQKSKVTNQSKSILRISISKKE